MLGPIPGSTMSYALIVPDALTLTPDCPWPFGPSYAMTIEMWLKPSAGVWLFSSMWSSGNSIINLAANGMLSAQLGDTTLWSATPAFLGLWNFSAQNTQDATGTFGTNGGGGFQSNDLPIFAGALAAPSATIADDDDLIGELLNDIFSGAASEPGFLRRRLSARALRHEQRQPDRRINWDTLVDSMRDAIADIDANWNDLLTGQTSPSQMTQYVAVGTDLTQISEAVIPGSIDPTSPGLLSDLVAMVLPNAQGVQTTAADPAFRHSRPTSRRRTSLSCGSGTAR
jgi:hypothetical protein